MASNMTDKQKHGADKGGLIRSAPAKQELK